LTPRKLQACVPSSVRERESASLNQDQQLVMAETTTPTMTPQQLVSAVRSKDPMHGLCASRQITDEGCDWLKFALDPFHDLQLDNLRGYPDVNTEPTVIVKIRQAIELSAPAGLPANTNWDCHLALSPIDWAKPNGTLTHVPSSETGYNVAAEVHPQGQGAGFPAGQIEQVGAASGGVDAVTARLDGLVINSVPAGLPNDGDMTFTPGHCPNTAAGGYSVENITLDKYLDYDTTDLGVYRLVYSGFEVVNTTAQIYKQGAVTVYEYGHSFENAQATVPFEQNYGDPSATPPVLPTITPNSLATNQFRSPPNTIAEAKIMPGAHTWAAQDGCYCTAKFQGDNPFQGATNRNYIIQQNNPSAGSASGYNPTQQAHTVGSFVSPGFLGPINNSVVGTTNKQYGGDPGMTAAPATHFSRMSTAGAYFTGLSPQTTLFVTWRVGIERLPAANKPTFLALAQPSATFDPNALLLYNLIANHLPPGCPQGWNDLGKWFNNIANVAKRVIPGAFPLVSTAQMILNGLGAVQQAKALPDVVRGAQQVYAIAKGGLGSGGRPRVPAAQVIQAAARRRQAQRQQKPALQNFGQPAAPGGGRRRGNRVQQFSQMS
jgi:hypothetical protein